MALPPILRDRLRLPAIASPLFIISGPDLVIAQCKAGIVGSFPSLNARPISLLDEWLDRITSELAAWDKVITAKASENPLFKKVLDSQKAFAQRAGAWQNASTSSRGTSQFLSFAFSTGSRFFEPCPLPWTIRTQRWPRCAASSTNSATCRAASNRFRPCRSRPACTTQ